MFFDEFMDVFRKIELLNILTKSFAIQFYKIIFFDQTVPIMSRFFVANIETIFYKLVLHLFFSPIIK